jgi:hypothetical protein
MTTKIIKIEVPLDWEEPPELNTFKPEENAFILDVGCETIKDARALIAGLSQQEIYNKIREESKSEIQKLEMDLLVQKEIKSKMEVTLKESYDNLLKEIIKKNDELKIQIIKYESQNKDVIRQEVEKEISKYKLLLDEKDKQLNKINETHDLILKQNQKTTSHKGKDGEQVFEYYADESFRDFKGYSLVDKHTQGGAGDFHMLFDDFDVLVDAKNYKKKVPIDQRDKIKKYLIKNEHITFAWLVSLNTSIDKYDKSPVMYEWINTKQCIVYINNLIEYEDPRKLLRIVWFTCNELFKFIKEETIENVDTEELKNEKFKLLDKIKNTRKRIREINTSVNNTKNLIQMMDEELKELLSNETDDIVESNYGIFDEWWDVNIELTNEDELTLLSTDMWTKFKNDNKKIIKDSEITVDKFKQFLKIKLPHSKIILKSKSVNTAYEIKGIKFKEKNILCKKIEKENNDDKMVLVLNEIPNTKIKEKIVKSKFYFDEDKDNKIISEYLVKNNDVMEISEKNNIKPWEVVSLLVKYKIIVKRDEARGYDKYKETDEYKEKVIKK